MDKKEVFKKTSDLSIDIRKKREELNELVEKIGDIQDKCDHISLIMTLQEC